jgi:hypothetical protein
MGVGSEIAKFKHRKDKITKYRNYSKFEFCRWLSHLVYNGTLFAGVTHSFVYISIDVLVPLTAYIISK